MPDAGDRARALRIIARIRSYGVEVREMPGHESRGGTFVIVPVKVFDHHDGSSRKAGEWGSLGLILDGTPRGIPGPLSNVQVARCLDNVPRVAWVADGSCSHAGLGSGYGLPTNNANSRTYGVEKANDGLGEPYTAAANYATNAVFHAMAVECGAIPESFPLGHKEWTTRKIDPLYSMPDRRRQVGAFAPTQEDDMTPDELMNWPFVALSDGRAISFGEVVKSMDRNIGVLQTQVAALEALLAKPPVAGGASLDATKLLADVGTVVRDALGADNAAQADEIVDRLAARLGKPASV